MRSLTEPETIVADVPQNTSSKKNFAGSGTPAQPSEPKIALVVVARRPDCCPPRPAASRPPCPASPPSENISPNPTT